MLVELTDAVLAAVDGTTTWPDATIQSAIVNLAHADSCCLNTLHVADRTASVKIWPDTHFDPTMALMTARHAQDHPLLWHHITTADTTIRSPEEVSTTWRSGWVFSYLRATVGVTEHLAVPIQFTRHIRSSVVVGRADHPFTAGERAALGRAQQILRVAASAIVHHQATRQQIDELLAADSTPAPPLTPREAEVLDALATGRARDVVARELGVAPRTLDKHVEHINAKLGTSNLVGALHHRSRARITAHITKALPH